MNNSILIKPIAFDEWLPDRCLNGQEPFDPVESDLMAGCPGLNYYQQQSRETLEELYQFALKKFECCGFVAWENGRVVAYHNFFPFELSKTIQFYGWGSVSFEKNKTIIHNCLTIVKSYLRKGISSRLVMSSLDWAKENGWERFEVHNVLPDCERVWQAHQKSCHSFWRRLGFDIFEEYKADEGTEKYYGVTKTFSMAIDLTEK